MLVFGKLFVISVCFGSDLHRQKLLQSCSIKSGYFFSCFTFLFIFESFESLSWICGTRSLTNTAHLLILKCTKVKVQKKKRKMEAMKVMLVMCVMLDVIAGESKASFISSYTECSTLRVVSTKEVAGCAFQCLRQCRVVEIDQSISHSHLFCTLGCSANKCVDFSSKSNPSKSPFFTI